MEMHVRSLWLVKEVSSKIQSRREKKEVRLKSESDEKTVVLKIQTKQRDSNKQVKGEGGKLVENPRYGKFYYETVESIEIEQTTATEVKEAVLRGIANASKK